MAGVLQYSTRRRKTNRIQDLIENVRKFECLHNKKVKGFSNRVLRASVWRAIGENLGIAGIEAEKKWRVQRDRYNRERKRIKEGAANGSRYTPTWELYTLMDSVIGSCNNRGELTISNVLSLSDMNGQLQEERNQEMRFPLRKDYEEVPKMPTNRPVPNVTSQSVFKQRKCVPQLLLAETTQPTSSTIKPIDGNMDATDEIGLFCNLLKTKLRKLDSKDKILAMREIDTVVFEKATQNKYFS